MKNILLTALTLIILTLFVFSKNVLLKINESILGKLLFVLIIILFSYENTTYGLFIAILFFIVNEKFTYSYYENMSCQKSKKIEKEPFTTYTQEEVTKEKLKEIKPTSSSVVDLQEQLKSLTHNPRKKPVSLKPPTYIADPDVINLMNVKTSAFNNLYDDTKEFDYTNFYPTK
tara:strand:- start:886 stop:1404 length:519 start_codon:yes stop_codon:yes gene_type:complete